MLKLKCIHKVSEFEAVSASAPGDVTDYYLLTMNKSNDGGDDNDRGSCCHELVMFHVSVTHYTSVVLRDHCSCSLAFSSTSAQHKLSNGRVDFSMQRHKQRLMYRSIETIVATIEWVGHCRTQHVVEVDLSQLQQMTYLLFFDN